MPVQQTRPEAKVRPHVKVQSPPPYTPDLDAYGLKLTESGDIVPAVECPDLPPAQAMSSTTVQIDARLWEGKFDQETGRLRESRTTQRLNREQIQERYKPLRESLKLRESDWFAMGGFPGAGQESPLTQNYVPIIPGPATRQQYWADYWASSAKCFEASTHSGIARRACKAMTNFPLSRGVQWKISEEKAQKAWEEFWTVNRMNHRTRQILYDLSIFGEQFLRYFPVRRGQKGVLLIRQLDPATIYEVVTDQEDLETVYFYHQQFQTRMELYSPPTGNRAPEGPTQTGVTRYIIRQIDAEEIDHYRINVVSGEARGRSDLFPVLGDLKRLRDLLTSKVVQSDVATRIMGVLSAKGTNADINRTLSAIFPNGQTPAPGTFVGINDQVKLEALDLSPSAGIREDFTYEELIDSIVAGVGISRADLGLSPAQSSGTTQATAITSQTSGGKSYEERQLLLKEMLEDMFARVMDAAGITADVDHEFILPELAKEDRSAKLKDLSTAEGMGWIGKQTAATSAAAELGFTTYDFDEEMELIAAEFDLATDEEDGDPAQGGKIRRPMILASLRQTPKLDPTKAQAVDDEPAGVLVGPGGAQITGQMVPGAGGPTPPGNAGGPGNGDTPEQKTTGGLPAAKAPGAQGTNSGGIKWKESTRLREWIPYEIWLANERKGDAAQDAAQAAAGAGDHHPSTQPFQLDGGGKGSDTRAAEKQASDFAKQNFKQQTTDAQKEALKQYQSTADEGDKGKNLNALLRSGGKTGEYTGLIADLDKTLAGSHVSQDMVVYRGLTGAELTPGSVIADEGYVSTSMLAATGEFFASGKSPAIVEIHIPAGSSAVSMDAAGLGGSLGESEVLLPRGSQFSVDQVEDGHSKGVSGKNFTHVVMTYRGPMGSGRRTREADKPTSSKGSGSRFMWTPDDFKVAERTREASIEHTVGEHIRREPTDPEYVAHVDEFTAATQKNLEQFLTELQV